MKTFNIDVRVTGYSQVTVQAETLEEAEEKAMDAVMNYKVGDLRWKETQCTYLDADQGN